MDQENLNKPKKRAYNESRRNSNRRWDDANLDRLSLALPKGTKDEISEYIQSHGFTSVNNFVATAISEAIGTQMTKGADGSIFYPEK